MVVEQVRQWLRRMPGGAVSLRWKVIVITLILALVPVLVLGFVLNTRSSEALEDQALRGLESQAETIELSLNETVNGHAADAALLARSSFLFFTSASTQARQQFLQDHADFWGFAEDIQIIDNDGNVDVALGDLRQYSNQAEAPYYQAASQLEPGQVFIGDIQFDDALGEQVINIATPSYNDAGVFVGVLRITWPIQDLISQATVLGQGEDLKISIVDNSGVVVASSDQSDIGADRSTVSAVNAALSGRSGTAREPIGADSDEHFIAYAPVAESPVISGLGWGIVVSAPAQTVLAPAVSNRNWTIAALIVVALIAVLSALFLTRYLVGPIQRLAYAAREVAAGNYQTRVPVTSRDEVGTTAQAFNQMLDEITGLIQTREDRNRIQNEIMQLLNEVNAAADGDLTVEAEVTAGELGSVADSFNFMIGELRNIISNVNETTTAVSSASVEIAQSSSQLASSSELQSQQITRAVEAVEEMTVSIQRVAENANLSSEVAQEARHNAQLGGAAVQATIDGMNRIRNQVTEAQRIIVRLGESSEEIGSFVQLISQIARQTNTLALNASIQAARAGEHGRGFAVVAEEVRRLAERSSSASKQVASLVSSIQTETTEAVEAMRASTREVNDGSQLADDAGAALAEIDAVVGRLAELIEAISQAAEEQAQTSTQVSQMMREIDEVTRSTTEGTRTAAESVASLSSLAERLRESVSTFRIGGDQGMPRTVEGVADGD